MSHRFSGIPQHAVRKDRTFVALTPDGPQSPWHGLELQFFDDRVITWPLGVDITDSYNAWMAEQPKTHQVTFEWKDEA